jgi:hypothetical protein
VNAKRIYWLYTVRTKVRRKIARRQPTPAESHSTQRAMGDGFCERSVVRRTPGSGPEPWSISSLTRQKVALALSRVIAEHAAQESITVVNGTEFASKAAHAWVYPSRVRAAPAPARC